MIAGAARPALPEPAAAREPAEVRGAGRDDVRLLVDGGDGRLRHSRFAELPGLLEPGDLLVVNTSATLPAAVPARATDEELTLHLSSPTPDGHAWLVELRSGAERFHGGRAGQVLLLPGGALAVLLEPDGGGRLWLASLQLPAPVSDYLARHGRPISYAHVEGDWSLESYQTVYATDPGSAEMPSAGRAFTPELITRLMAKGVDLAPLTLHTGVSSLEAGERPYPERYEVPRFTAERVNLARALGGRVIAVGTTVVRALETAVDDAGRVEAAAGWTDLVIEPTTPIAAIDGLLSGFHDSDSSHLDMLEAVARSTRLGRVRRGRITRSADLLERAYTEAARAGYLRHEFGDLHLILR